MVRMIVTVAVLLLSLAAAIGEASQGLLAGQGGFGLSMVVIGPVYLARPFPIMVDAWSTRHGKNTVAEVHITVPDGIDLIEGDTLRRPHVSHVWMGGPRDSEWELKLRPSRAGHYEIHGWLKIPRDRPDAWDETDCLILMDVRPDTTLFTRGSATFVTRVGGNQRFAYGGDHMVLLDQDGPRPPGPIISKPEPVDPPVMSECRDCGLTEPIIIKFAVTVGAGGRVTWIEPPRRGEKPFEPRVRAAAEEALRRWQFRAARTESGRPVADWAEVDVVVKPAS